MLVIVCDPSFVQNDKWEIQLVDCLDKFQQVQLRLIILQCIELNDYLIINDKDFSVYKSYGIACDIGIDVFWIMKSLPQKQCIKI